MTPTAVAGDTASVQAAWIASTATLERRAAARPGQRPSEPPLLRCALRIALLDAIAFGANRACPPPGDADPCFGNARMVGPDDTTEAKRRLRALGWYVRYTEWPSGHQVVLHLRSETAVHLVTRWWPTEAEAFEEALSLAARHQADRAQAEPVPPP